MTDYTKMTKAELISVLKALEARTELQAAAPSRPEKFQQIVNDLQVHHVELEIQNRELRDTQQLLEESRDRYATLFDFSPIGYITLDDKGSIREINLTAASMFGLNRQALLNMP